MSAIAAPHSVLIIVVHYGDVNLTRRLLESLSRLEHFSRLHVLVVNNDSRDEVRGAVRSAVGALSNARVVETGENRGYFAAAKVALDYYQMAHCELPAWLIICNNDIMIEDRLFLEKLINRNPQKVAVIAPRIVSTVTQCDQNPFMRRRPGRLRVAELRFWLANYHLARFHEWLSVYKKALRRWIRQASFNRLCSGIAMRETIYASHGSFIVFSHKYFDQGGFIDDKFFLYAEEISVAETCRRLGLPALYEPELVVLHQEHSTTGHTFSRATYRRQKEALRYLADHYLTKVPRLRFEEPPCF